jgi:hypothetical protein
MIETPPPIVDMVIKMLPPPIMRQLMSIVNEIKPFVVAYAKTFAIVAAEWLESLGKLEIHKQFQKIMKGRQEHLSLTKYIDSFHKYAIGAVFTVVQPSLKRAAQTVYDEAMATASALTATRASIRGGTDLFAAAKSVLSPEMVGKLEGLLGDVAPLLKRFLDGVWSAFMGWRKGGGDARIQRASDKLRAALAKAGSSTWPPDWNADWGAKRLELGLDLELSTTGGLCIPVVVPIVEFLTKGIMEAAMWLRDKMSTIGGEIQAQCDMIELDVEWTPTALRREFSKLVQVKIVELARAKIVPQLDKAIEAVGLPNRVLVSQLRAIVFDLAEKLVRKATNTKVIAIYDKLRGDMKMPNCQECQSVFSNLQEEEDSVTATLTLEGMAGAIPNSAQRRSAAVEDDLSIIEKGTDARANFDKAFSEDMAALLQIDASRVRVTGVTAGSVVVAFGIAPDEAGAPFNADALTTAFEDAVTLTNLASQPDLGISDEPVSLALGAVAAPEEDEDEFGYSVSEDKYTDLQPRYGFMPSPPSGAGTLQAQVNKVIDKEVMQNMEDALGPMLPMIVAFTTAAGNAAKQWHGETGTSLLEQAEAQAQAAFDKQKKKKKELEDLIASAKQGIEVPVFDFVKSGLQRTLEMLLPECKARGGAVLGFLESLDLPLDDMSSLNASDFRRYVGQLFQEWIVDKACESSFPQLNL